MAEPAGRIRVGEWFQGPTGSGQGGWSAHRLRLAAGRPVTVAIRAPIPVERDLEIVDAPGDDGWWLVDPAGPATPVLEAAPWTPDVPDTDPVGIVDAALAGRRFPYADPHPVPHCFSCGNQPDSMQVHAGPLDDRRWATDWTVPWWAVKPDGTVDEGALWAAIDCTQAWYVGKGNSGEHGVTVQLAVEVVLPLVAGASYALVAWAGDYPAGWDGRKRGACGAVFDERGRCVARSRSFWVEPAPAG